MPKTTTRSRQELRAKFARNAIPSETDFAELINASLNQLDDGLFRLADASLGIVRQSQKPDDPVLRFFGDSSSDQTAWQVQLGTGGQPSLTLATGGGKPTILFDSATGNVGIGTQKPVSTIQVVGNASITGLEGANFACMNGHMAPGSMTIGGTDRSYGGGKKWNANTAGLLLETSDNTEIAVHDFGTRLASFMYYDSPKNKFLIGRDMGYGPVSAVDINGPLSVAGDLRVDGRVKSLNQCTQVSATDKIDLPYKGGSWTDMKDMSFTADMDGIVLFLFKTGGVQLTDLRPGLAFTAGRVAFRLLVDSVQKAFTTHEFSNVHIGWELRDVSLVCLEPNLSPGKHTITIQWRIDDLVLSGVSTALQKATACWYGDLRTLVAINL